MPKGVFLENDLITSPAWKAIRSQKTFLVLIEFYRRRKMSKSKDRKGCPGTPTILNNGELILTYKEAKARLGIPQATYSRCLTELVSLGFLDVAEPSCGLHRQATKWTISKRWKKYGQADFKIVDRERITPPFAKKRKNQLSNMEAINT